MCVCACVSEGTFEGERGQIFLELDLYPVVGCPIWMLGQKLGPCIRAVHSSNCCAIFLVLAFAIF